jgi:hypothetical protein
VNGIGGTIHGEKSADLGSGAQVVAAAEAEAKRQHLAEDPVRRQISLHKLFELNQ